MSKTVLCVLLKMLMLTRAESKYPDSDFIQSYPDNASVRNKVDEIPFGNMSMFPERNKRSILSKPTSPRAFVEFHNKFLNGEDDIFVRFRWNQFESTDEKIQRYTVQYWFIENQKEIQICDNKSISATIKECIVHNLKPNTTYYFQARAHSKVGAGPYTDLIDISTTHEKLIPQLLIVLYDKGIDIWDLDSKTTVNLVNDKNVKYATYSIAEDKIYWSNSNNELMMLDRNKSSTTKIANLKKIAVNLCIDWVARNLYWVDKNDNLDNIIKLDLALWQKGEYKYTILQMYRSTVHSSHLNILPSIGIFYLQNFTKDDKCQIIQSDLDGNNTHTIQKNLTAISCSLNNKSFDMTNARITVDVEIDINTKRPRIYWLLNNSLFVTDFYVSMCNLILTEKEKLYFLTIDKTNIYFKSSNNIYVLEKKYARLENTKDVNARKHTTKLNLRNYPKINKVYAYGKSLQSFPAMKCLTPDEKDYNVENVTVTTNSIIVNLPEPVLKNGCKRYNLPTTLYTIYGYFWNCELNKTDNFTKLTHERYYEIQNLMPLTEYTLLLVISNFYFDKSSMPPLSGSKVIRRTKPDKLEAPESVTLQALTPTIAAVYWMQPKKLHCVPVIYEVHWTLINLGNSMRRMSEILLINKTEHKEDSKFFKIIEPLIPAQKYRVYVRIYPLNYSELHTDSLSKTLYMYSEPNNITLNEVSINGMNISWIPSVNLIIHYVLEYKNVKIQKWQIAKNFESNNGEKTMYYIKNLLPGTLYEFRLRLRYPKYEKEFIWPSDGRFTFLTLTSDVSSTGISLMRYYLSFIVSFVAVVTIICVCYFSYLYRQRKKSNEQVLPPIITDIELAILHEIPNGNIQFNTLYSPMLQYNSNDYVLTKIKREEIRLGKLLGSGAFGMVYQGKVKNLEGPGTEISAAIKMLPKNASSKEKEKFLKEAKLMNHFRHKHVLRLLAVCLDKHSPLIVLELMEVGDLLQYLRDSRKLQLSDSHALRLQDLFSMCEDVVRGCCYLENLRFVHRDLACRNCLVSARNRENRIIKIGDFGLARDIYKDDYYCVKGQGILPVPWMAPESLVLGIFTSQSDVWSFGVLMWEITSLGEKPYTGKCNEEVIDYVRAGGRLPMPLNCPPTLYELMLRCWSPTNDRPNFKLCLKNIIALRNNIENTSLGLVDII